MRKSNVLNYTFLGIIVLVLIGGVIMWTQSAYKTTNRTGLEVGEGGGPPQLLPGTSRMQIPLASIQGSGINQSGTATLEEKNGKVTVRLDLNRVSEINTPQPAHMHFGSCPGVGSVVYPLNEVVNGKSETVLNTTLEQIRRQLPMAINVHKSQQEITMYTSCGDLR